MNKKTSDNQSVILSAIKRLGSSLRVEIRTGDKLLRREILKVEERVEGLEETQRGFNAGQAVMNKKIDNLQNDLDGFMGKVEALEQENSLGVKQYRDHEKRIAKLESSTHPA